MDLGHGRVASTATASWPWWSYPTRGWHGPSPPRWPSPRLREAWAS